MKRFLALAAVGMCIVVASANHSDARHRRIYYSAPYRYYVAPPVVYDPVFVAPPPIVIYEPAYRIPVYRVPPRPVYVVPRRVRYGPREVKVKYKRTRYGYRIEYDIDDD